MDQAEASGEQADQPRRYTLEKEHEFRFEVEFEQAGTITLLSGTAEMFGTELAQGRQYRFVGTKGAVFSWQGAVLEASANVRAYIANETPMLTYAQLHAFLEQRRAVSTRLDIFGPRVILVGPTDSGKTTLSRILTGYCVRRGGQPTYIDLDIGQGSITLPGVMACSPIERPADVQEGFTTAVPLAYFYGHTNMESNPHLFRLHIKAIAQAVNTRLEKSTAPEIRHSGCVINTAGWVDGLGYKLLVEAIDVFKADVVCVIDHERLYNDLLMQYKDRKDIRIFKLIKSGGVVTRDNTFRRKSRMSRVREYFYGVSGDLCPHSTTIDFKDVTIYRVGGGPSAPSSALPIGAAPTTDPVQLVEVPPSSELLHSILAVSHAPSPDQLLARSVAGFLYVTDVNYDKKKITVLAPCPGNLPSRHLILGTLKWLE